jgi:hypothetical protein
MKIAIACITVLVALGGAFAGINSYFAKDSELVLVAQRLEIKILDDRYNAIRERIWNLESKFGEQCKNAPLEVRREYRKLLLELEKISRELKKMGYAK